MFTVLIEYPDRPRIEHVDRIGEICIRLTRVGPMRFVRTGDGLVPDPQTDRLIRVPRYSIPTPEPIPELDPIWAGHMPLLGDRDEETNPVYLSGEPADHPLFTNTDHAYL